MKTAQFIFFWCLCITVRSFSQQVEWAKSEPYSGNVTATNCIAHDEEGNSIVAGKRDYYTYPYGTDVYLIKYYKDGTKLWEKIFRNSHVVRNLIVDKEGNSYILISPGYLFFDNVTYQSKYGTLLLKFTKNGELVWVKDPNLSYIGASNDKGFYGTGFFKGFKDFGNGVILYAPPSDSVKEFLAFFNYDFICQWAEIEKGSTPEYIYGNSDSSFFVSGYIYNQITLGKGTSQVTLFEKDGFNYQAKYSHQGELMWAKQLNTNLSAADPLGNYYAFVYDNNYPNSVFLAKYSKSGSLLWKRTKWTGNDTYKAQLVCNNNGDVFLSCSFRGDLVLKDTLLRSSTYVLFLAKLDSTGKLKWITTSNGKGSAGSKAISVDDKGYIYITGDMDGEVSFGNYTLNEPGGGIFTLKIMDLDFVPNSVENHEPKNTFTIFPNPGSCCFTIQSVQQMQVIRVRNILGSEVFYKKLQTPETSLQLDLSAQPKGVYFVEIENAGTKSIEKIVLQ